ncbi:hypothetical protein [Leptospira licerasiae]|uniref:hypothetical protein n=1 Tax=Leptospira licerasiae TaxID=447106 RepID=UPI0030163568
MRLLVIFILNCLIVNCYVESLPWRYTPHPVEGSANNYLKIFLPEQLGPNWITRGYVVNALVEKKGSLLDRMIMINPDKGIHFYNLLGGVEQYKYSAGCELIFPIPGGKNRFEIRLGQYIYGFYFHEYVDVELKQDKSLRMTLVYNEPPPSGSPYGYKFYSLVSSVEDSSIHSSYAKCDLR